MYKLILKISILLFTILSPVTVYAEQTTMFLDKVQLDDTGRQIEPKPNGNRLPARRVMCTIGDDGVRIDGYIAEDDILSYEVWDASGEVCVASFADERDFINGLKLMYGDYQVRFAVADYLFIGYITL